MVISLGPSGCGEQAWEERQFWVSVTVPSAGWDLNITEVYAVNGELWVISELTPPDGPAATVISNVSDTLTVAAPPGPVQHVVIGKNWDWDNDDMHRYVASRDELPGELDNARRIYPQP